MKVNWAKALWWVCLLLMIYAVLLTLALQGCREPQVFANGDPVHGTDVLEPDMPGYELDHSR